MVWYDGFKMGRMGKKVNLNVGNSWLGSKEK
jgi:hypothetical protein